jgi:hypothetical protein
MTIITKNTLKTHRLFIEISFHPTLRTIVSAHVVPTAKQDGDHGVRRALNISKISEITRK